jgi:hypothetical protein
MANNRVYLHKFRVRGVGQFPLDMLRYDRCFPDTGDDAAGLHSDCRIRREITLIAANREPYWKPTEGRWSSFLWSVVKEKVDG